MSAVLCAKQDLKLEPRPMPEIGPRDVLLAMDCVGICSTDIHLWQEGKIGAGVLGIGSCGAGDRVVIEPGKFCRDCEMCRRGRYNLCPFMQFHSCPPTDGLLQNYFTHDANMCHKMPDHPTMEEGALCEPLIVGVAAARRAKVKLSSNVLIVGAGPIGIATAIVCQTFGATKVTVIDKKPDRLEKAAGFGNSTGWGGTCCLVDMASGNFTNFPLMDDVMREVEITANFRYSNDFPSAVNIAGHCKYDLSNLISHRFDLEEALNAFETACKQKKGSMKLLIHMLPQEAYNEKE
uniref:Alcohol dehydrogenase-like N-terminal domain-containing protein n=1 Tax=Glossina austeni TaxID=7395 RepID=A0A1A9VGV2_GLOAU